MDSVSHRNLALVKMHFTKYQVGYLIEYKKNGNFNISHEDVFLQVYSFLSTSK